MRRRRKPKCKWCRKRAKTTVERLDPKTMKPVMVPYCGTC